MDMGHCWQRMEQITLERACEGASDFDCVLVGDCAGSVCVKCRGKEASELVENCLEYQEWVLATDVKKFL